MTRLNKNRLRQMRRTLIAMLNEIEDELEMPRSIQPRARRRKHDAPDTDTDRVAAGRNGHTDTRRIDHQ